MGIRWEYYEGHAISCITILNRAVGQYARRNSHLKIGLTVNPEDRWRKHSKDGWREMVVIYSTRSRKYCGQVETQLIRHGWLNHHEKCWNIREGGGGLKSGAARYYIYIVLA